MRIHHSKLPSLFLHREISFSKEGNFEQPPENLEIMWFDIKKWLIIQDYDQAVYIRQKKTHVIT